MAEEFDTRSIPVGELAAYTRSVLDLGIRLGEVIFAAGAGAEDAVAAMTGVCRAYGLRSTEADVTHTVIALTHENAATHETISRSRNVKYRILDYSKLTEASQLIGELMEHPIPIPDARRRIAAIVGARPFLPRWVRGLGWSLVGGGAAVLIGGGWQVAIAAFFATFVIDALTTVLAKRRVPVFYQTAAGGAIGPLVAALLAWLYPESDPSLVVAAAIIMLLAGVTTFGAVHDTLSGFYLTGTARAMEALLITGGLVTGVLGSTLALARIGIVLNVSPRVVPTIDAVPVLLLAAVVVVIGFSLAVQMPLRALWAVSLLGALAEFVYLVGINSDVGLIWASGFAAFVVGLLAAVTAHVARTPSLAIVVAALVPLVPGLILFRSLMQLSENDITGLLNALTAASVAVALAAGAILGQYIVLSLWGPTRRLQRHFVGPLMALPVQLGRARNAGRKV